MGGLILTVCSNADLHVNDTSFLLIRKKKFYTIKLEANQLIFYEPSPEFVQEFFENLSKDFQFTLLHGCCVRCYEIFEASEELIKEMGGQDGDQNVP